MTPLRFRAWDKKQSKMIDLYKFTPLALDSELKQDGVFIPFADNLIIMQSVGLKDKNEKEIFEGDIIRRKTFKKDGSPNGHVYSTVVWDQERAAFKYNAGVHCEIIGSLYENPDLLPDT